MITSLAQETAKSAPHLTSPLTKGENRLKRIHLLAAEIFSYSYSNYEGHLGINKRFDELMPKDAEMLETAVNEGWSVEKVANNLQTSLDAAQKFINATREALIIVDASNPAESFREGIRQSIQHALEDGLDSEEAIESLIIQICYRAADLGVLLDKAGHRLSQYSRHLRKEPDVNYYEGYFDEPFQK